MALKGKVAERVRSVLSKHGVDLAEDAFETVGEQIGYIRMQLYERGFPERAITPTAWLVTGCFNVPEIADRFSLTRQAIYYRIDNALTECFGEDGK